MNQKHKNSVRISRSRRVRAKISGNAERPRLVIFRSNKHVSVQLIDDQRGITIAHASSKKIATGKTKTEKSVAVGMEIAKAAKSAGIASAVFDRRGYRYHGRVKAVAESAREGGLSM